MNITSDYKSEGQEEKEELQISIKEILELNNNISSTNYLSEPSLNSELLLFNNSKLLLSSIKKNISNLSINLILDKKVNFKADRKLNKDNFIKEFEIINFKKVHTKMVFMKNIPKYNNEYLLEIIQLREQYEKLNCNDSPGLQKIKREIRNRIRDLSKKTFIYRDKNIFGTMIMKVMDKLVTRPNFSGYSYKDEMKSLAIEHILKYTWRFNSYRQSKISFQYISSFTYITTIIFNAFVATINKQNEEHKKAKSEFQETQVLKHRDKNISTYGKDYSTPDKIVKIQVINSTLFNELQKILVDVKDILVNYPICYNIDMREYKQIMDWSQSNNINLSLLRYGELNE